MSEVNRRAQARVGTWLLDKWKLDALVGVGGMAAVYAAQHRNGNRVAIKLLHLELSLDADARDRFLREGYVANKVGHTGAVAVLDDAEAEDGSIFLVMELLEGLSLSELCDQNPGSVLELSQAVRITDQLLDVLAAAHRAGIVHRDLKPENVFITTDGRVKLLDFGIAKLRDGESVFKTRTGDSMGTPAFMPPEQAAGRWSEVGPHSDLWALGATLFTLLTGQIVHDGDTAQLIMVNAITKPAPSVLSLRADLPAQLAAVIDRSLAFKPTARFSSAQEMRAALQQAYPLAEGVSTQLAAAAQRPKIGRNEFSLATLVAREGEATIAEPAEVATTVPKSRVETQIGSQRNLLWPLLAAGALACGITAIAFTAFNREASSPAVLQSETGAVATHANKPPTVMAQTSSDHGGSVNGGASAAPASSAAASSAAVEVSSASTGASPSATPTPTAASAKVRPAASPQPKASGSSIYERRKD